MICQSLLGGVWVGIRQSRVIINSIDESVDCAAGQYDVCAQLFLSEWEKTSLITRLMSPMIGPRAFSSPTARPTTKRE
jgi:hypothetical protein